MNKRFIFMGTFLSLFLLAGCGQVTQLENQIESEETTKDAQEITNGPLDENYQALLEDGKYKLGVSLEVESSRLNSNYNQNNFETGLLRASTKHFPTDKFAFQEGQKIDGSVLKSWLQRKSKENPDGLNPEDENRPLGIQKILEYDFFSKNDKQFSGLSIGIALNEVDYTKNPPVSLSSDEMLNQGRQVANSILTRIRQMPDLKKVPIYVALFQQATKENVAGGKFIYGALSNETATIDKWEPINEEYYLLPTTGDNEVSQTGLNDQFVKFKNKILNFFPNLTGVSGLAHYVDGNIVKLTITIQSGYYAKPEIISFTQFIAQEATGTFDGNTAFEITVNAVAGPQSYVLKNKNQKEAIVHVFN